MFLLLTVVQLLAICCDWSHLQAVPTAENSTRNDSTPGARGTTGHLPLMKKPNDRLLPTFRCGGGASVFFLGASKSHELHLDRERILEAHLASLPIHGRGRGDRSTRPSPWPRSTPTSRNLSSHPSALAPARLLTRLWGVSFVNVFWLTVLLGFSPCQSIRGLPKTSQKPWALTVRRRCDAYI